MDGIDSLTWEVMDRATTTLERAFSTDPIFTWIFPDPTRRPQSLRRLNRVPLEYGLRYGHVTSPTTGWRWHSGFLRVAHSKRIELSSAYSPTSFSSADGAQ